MKSNIRHEMNEGAQATIKAMRSIVNYMRNSGQISQLAAEEFRRKIRVHIKACSAREGGLGRK